MPIMINDSARYAAAAAGRAFSLTVRAEALANDIDALHRDIRAAQDESLCRAVFRSDSST